MTEEWRDVKGFEGEFQVSNLGNVRGLKRKPYVHVNQNGYIQTVLRTGDSWATRKDKFAYIHRLVAEAFLPNPDNLPEVHHKDCDKHNNRVDNLAWVTVAQNRGQWRTRPKQKRDLSETERRAAIELYRHLHSVERVHETTGLCMRALRECIREAKKDGELV